MVTKVKAKTPTKNMTRIVRSAPAPVRPTDIWPFPTPGVAKPKKVVKKASPAKAKSIPKDRKIHVVKATLSNVELAKAKSALSLDLYANDKKIGNLEVGQGSFFWTGARRQKSKPIGWSKFAAMMDDLAYKD